VQELPLILLAEDREDDILLLQRSFLQAGIRNPFQVVRDGEDAIAYMEGTGNYSKRDEFPVPELILLDLKLPKLDGFEVLRWIRSQRNFTGIRVVVLSSSGSIQDVNLAYNLGANSFLVKPSNFNDFAELSSFINDYWFVLSRTPERFRKPARTEPRPQKKDVLIREKRSGCFFAGHARWVTARADALDFERIELAETVATAEHFEGVEIVVAYEAPVCELTVPVAFAGIRRP